MIASLADINWSGFWGNIWFFLGWGLFCYTAGHLTGRRLLRLFTGK